MQKTSVDSERIGTSGDQPSSVVIIPARYASTRLPGKPLHKIAGVPMIERVWRIAQAATGNPKAVYVATDSDEIRAFCEGIGAQVLMTGEACRNGTERVCEALAALSYRPEIVVNMQGDVPLLPPSVVSDLLVAMKETGAGLATPAWQLRWDEVDALAEARSEGSSSGTLVTCDLKMNALYFSSALIPYIRGERKGDLSPLLRHIGMYGFTPTTLEQYVALEPSPLEQIEKLEGLRALENGMPVKIVPVDIKGRTLWSVDAPADVTMVEHLLSSEGAVL